MISNEEISKIIDIHMPGQRILEIMDRGNWIRQIYEIRLAAGSTVFIKIKSHGQWGETRHEENVVNMLHKNNMPAPRVFAVDDTCSIIGYPYIIQEKLGGTRLGDLISVLGKKEKAEIYQSIGNFYWRMHNIQNQTSGLWSDDPYTVRYQVSPNEYMYRAEILSGSSELARNKGIISSKIYDEIVHVWKNNMDYLKAHQPSMVHVSPFLWNIYLKRDSLKWEVTKIMALGDVIWWDPAFDLALIKYPVFGKYDKNSWEGFLQGYEEKPDEKRILLYALMQGMCAVMGVYMEPGKYRNTKWKNEFLMDIESILERIKMAAIC